jgi:hypothetical protein
MNRRSKSLSVQRGPITALRVIAASRFVLGGATLAVTVSSCGMWQEPALGSGGSGMGAGRRDRPDDQSLPTLVPEGVETVIDIDMAALRRSPWIAPVLQSRDPRATATKAEALGYDDVLDVDRIIYAVTTAGADAPTLVIAQGRLQSNRVEDAFRIRWPAAVVDHWRGIPLLSSGENAIAFLTTRTFASGPPAQVRAVVDRAYGIGPHLGTDPVLGPVRRALCPDGAEPAVLITVAVDQPIRARIGDAVPLPRELRQVGLRVDVGQSLDLQALGILDDRSAADALARRLSALLGDRGTRLALASMGLAVLLAETRVTADGSRVRIRTSLGDEHRDEVTASLRTLMISMRGQPAAGALGSW